ncbi:Uncharacterized protein HZ326_19664 [Fusarium oxysporum f. sp. albedinis]|nr:Uncharacterized protein HZ326_19664 [Fusarium oxysporum f. sp. albedinis]
MAKQDLLKPNYPRFDTDSRLKGPHEYDPTVLDSRRSGNQWQIMVPRKLESTEVEDIQEYIKQHYKSTVSS